jgi:hypothetical protein
MSREESVRGVLVRSVLKQAESADEDELLLLESALELLLRKLQSMDGGLS